MSDKPPWDSLISLSLSPSRALHKFNLHKFSNSIFISSSRPSRPGVWAPGQLWAQAKAALPVPAAERLLGLGRSPPHSLALSRSPVRVRARSSSSLYFSRSLARGACLPWGMLARFVSRSLRAAVERRDGRARLAVLSLPGSVLRGARLLVLLLGCFGPWDSVCRSLVWCAR